ncbi:MULTISPECIES: hypothetical protein [unclassified Pseudomonas]|uniref:hypothetical protein n=1 Tax=unclassified Pseudomonas TaxID=196821 RepID=UPI001C491ACD|nr:MULTISPECIES: hypothetical protein [unclassified Pseudomonas]MBV6754376.1 hypothetical protein [Pseudomonas chlororaphis]
MTRPTFIIGGWSQTLSRDPMPYFTRMMYGMVTNLDGLTTGTSSAPGWSPTTSKAPRPTDYSGQVLWTYGGDLCSPKAKPAQDEIDTIVKATLDNGWDGVDFKDDCQMNIPNVIETMRVLKKHGKQTHFGFIPGDSYNTPSSCVGKELNDKLRQMIQSRYCDQLVHHCYASRMWTDTEIERYVGRSLERTLAHGASADQVILALSTRGLTDHNLNAFLDQVTRLKIGGLYIWACHKLLASHQRTIAERLELKPALPRCELSWETFPGRTIIV